MSAIVHAACLWGIRAHPVRVEVELTQGLPGFDLVGLPEAAVRESQVRVRAALHKCGRELPPRRVVVNLAPADLKKSGSSFDLAIAVAVLTAFGACAPNRLHETLMVGELSLSGQVQPVRGVLAFLEAAKILGLRSAVIPRGNAQEASLVSELDVYCAAHLNEVLTFLEGQTDLPHAHELEKANSSAKIFQTPEDLSDVHGQESVKRAFEIAAAGNHNILLVGPPGSGKTMLARRLISILPPPTAAEVLEIATIASAAGQALPGTACNIQRPFRSPHFSASEAAVLGGGHPIRPGEVTLAHAGVLFLDELPEFRRGVIEGLRITMELGYAVIARAHQRLTMPARSLVLAAMNPCPCGFHGDPKRVCRCTPSQIATYQARVSGPIVDRFDMHISVPAVSAEKLSTRPSLAESSHTIAQRVMQAQRWRQKRIALEEQALPGHKIGELTSMTAQTCRPALRLLNQAFEQLGLSARGYVKVLRIARTLADLEQIGEIQEQHIAEAIQYRLLDRRIA